MSNRDSGRNQFLLQVGLVFFSPFFMTCQKIFICFLHFLFFFSGAASECFALIKIWGLFGECVLRRKQEMSFYHYLYLLMLLCFDHVNKYQGGC